MKTATFLCFVGAFLFTPTLSMIWFTTEDPARAGEYEDADLRTMFALISADLDAGHQVAIAAPPTIFSPPVGTTHDFLTDFRDPNNNWIDEPTGLPYEYVIGGRFSNIDFEQGIIQLVTLQTVEEAYEGQSSLRFDLTVRLEELNMYSQINCNGSWRVRNLDIEGGTFAALLTNLELRYQARFHLERGVGQHVNWFLGQSIGQSVVTVNRVTVISTDITDDDDETLFEWDWETEPDGEHVDELFRSGMSTVLGNAGDAIERLIRGAIGSRPYIVPHVTLVTRPANASGYSCRKRRFRERRETKLFNLMPM